MTTIPFELSPVVDALRAEVARSSAGAKRLKLRTLIGKFGYVKRSDANTAEITQVLSDAGLTINPPIVRFGDDWEITLEDWIYLSSGDVSAGLVDEAEATPSPRWNADGWFDRVAGLALRTEKEVEIKFVVPLLARLGYTDDDRYDGMPVPAAHGSRDTTLVIDFACFNATVEALKNQPLLTVEAKRESRLVKQKELMSAHNQAKSYCLWTQCDYFLVTDSRSVMAFHVACGGLHSLRPLFECARHELAERFEELYSLLSKEALTRHYLAKLSTTQEVA